MGEFEAKLLAWWVPIALAALTPIAASLGTVTANEIRKLQEKGWKL